MVKLGLILCFFVASRGDTVKRSNFTFDLTFDPIIDFNLKLLSML